MYPIINSELSLKPLQEIEFYLGLSNKNICLFSLVWERKKS